MEIGASGADRWCGLACYAGLTVFAGCIPIRYGPGMLLAAGATCIAIGEWLCRAKMEHRTRSGRRTDPPRYKTVEFRFWRPTGIAFYVAGGLLVLGGLYALTAGPSLICG